MIPEFGHYALILALCLAATQAIIPLMGAVKENIAWMQLAKFTAYGQLLFISISFFTLAYAFLINDFSVAYVAENSNRQLPIIYRFCAVWGAHEGSLLLWVFILSIWMTAVSIFSRSLPLATVARVLSVLGMVSFGFLLFLLTTSDPFARILPNFPQHGENLNPLLQDPGLVIHPPMLYMGYVGFSVAFAFAIAALITGRLDAAWTRWSRPWTLIAWCFLTLGIILGSWWAYRELGWGGWWFWDPVENASFLPWLVGTALIHSLMVTEKRHAFKAWTVLLAICTFSLSLLGTFLVRSGVLISVHAFALDPRRGDFMLLFIALVVGISLMLYAWRGNKIRGSADFSFFSRETLLLSNNIFLTIAMATVLLGTLYPLIVQTLNWGKISVGPPYFNCVFVPLMVPFLLLMGFAPFVHWRQMLFTSLIKKLGLTFLFTILISLFLLWLIIGRISPLVALGLVLALWIVFATLQHLRSPLTRAKLAMIIAHIGVAVCVIGIVFASAYSVERDVRMQRGDVAKVGPYQFQFLGVRNITGSDYQGVEAGILVTKNDREIALLKPQQRLFMPQQIALAKAAINMGLFRDLYVALGEPIGNNAWALRIYYKPFVRWIWLGGLLMILGGILALSDPRYRIKLKKRSHPERSEGSFNKDSSLIAQNDIF